MVTWSPENKDKALAHLCDLAANIERFRMVVVIAVDEVGGTGVVRMRSDMTSSAELYGALKMTAALEEREVLSGFSEADRPLRGGAEDA